MSVDRLLQEIEHLVLTPQFLYLNTFIYAKYNNGRVINPGRTIGLKKRPMQELSSLMRSDVENYTR